MDLDPMNLNFFGWIMTIAVGTFPICTGAQVISELGNFSHFFDGPLFAAPFVIIVGGSVTLLTALLGFYGAIKDIYILVKAVPVSFVLVMFLQYAVGMRAISFNRDFAMRIENSMKNSMMNYTDADQAAWDNVQRELVCCGVDSPSDWDQLSISRRAPPGDLPNSCCVHLRADESCRYEENNGQHSYGCYQALKDNVDGWSSEVLIPMIFFFLIPCQVMAAFFVLYFAKRMKTEAREEIPLIGRNNGLRSVNNLVI